MKPKLLLSGEGKMPWYIAAFTALGAEIEAEYCPEYRDGFDGLVLCGGVDIDPARYGQPVMGSVGMDPARDAAEYALIDAFLQADKPIFGICRGHQLLNVYFGGSLIQHIPTAEDHVMHDRVDSVHGVCAEPDSVLANLYGREFPVNSAHHQAVDRLGEGLRITARALDGTVEALEHMSLPVMSVQWHPERISCEKRRADASNGEILITHYIDFCRSRKGYGR